ncbi:M24 family metallopeptidase [Nocardia sp. NPDC059246]|uniref:M24 family metallopeptidase n=1 Tax=unclassified Nocardia TaxID=2637762 RepID=UPI0036AFF6DE
MSSTVPAWPGESEVDARISILKDNMAQEQLDALIITSQENFEYYTGFRTLFWISNSRPMIGIIRRDKSEVSIVMSRIEGQNEYYGRNPNVQAVFYSGFIGAALESAKDCLSGLPSGSAVGLDYGPDMFGRGSIALVDALRSEPHNFRLTDAADLIWRQRVIKTQHEFDAKRIVCKMATEAYFAGLGDLRLGMSEFEYGQLLKQRLIALGAESVDWLPVRFARGHKSPTQPNNDTKLQRDDFIWVDFGARRGDSISDLNRVAKVGKATPEQEKLYRFVRSVTLRVAEGIRPGMTGGDVFKLFDETWHERNIAASGLTHGAGRVGHGSGVGATEPPSLMPESTELIQEGMILHVEPKLVAADGVFEMEEVIRILPNGVEFLSEVSPEELPIVEL